MKAFSYGSKTSIRLASVCLVISGKQKTVSL